MRRKSRQQIETVGGRRRGVLITRLMTVEAFRATRVARCRCVCGVTGWAGLPAGSQ